MLPLNIDWAILSYGAECSAFATAFDAAIGQYFLAFGVEMPFTFHSICNINLFGFLDFFKVLLPA